MATSPRSRNVVITNEVEGSQRRASQFPRAPRNRKAGAELATAVDDLAVIKHTIPKGVSIEVDDGAFERFPCKDGHYSSFRDDAGMLRFLYTPLEHVSGE